ncbi:MAG: hypothetical protein PVJ40_02510 [Gammaproteobacteria bacterium]|jgi:hypothetical protein
MQWSEWTKQGPDTATWLVFGFIYIGTTPVFLWTLLRLLRALRRGRLDRKALFGALLSYFAAYIYLTGVAVLNHHAWVAVAVALFAVVAGIATTRRLRRPGPGP